MDDHGSSEASDLSLEDLMDEYSSLPPQIAEWFWCIEYVAKFVKDIRCILDLMNMGYHQYSNDYGRRIYEVLSLRVLEFMFDPSKNDATGAGVASTSEATVEFDLSLSNADVLRAILKEIPVTELRASMPELSKFNVLPFIAHKKMCLPQCALEKLRDVSQMENQTSAAPSVQANDPVCRDDRSGHMDMYGEEPIDEQPVHIGLEQNMNEKDKVISIDDEDEPKHTNEKDEVFMIDHDTENNQDTTSENRWPEDVSQMKNQTSAAPSMEADDPVFRDDRSVHMDMCEEEPMDEQQVHIGLEQNINEKDKVISIDDEDEPKHTNEKDEVFVIDDDTENDQDTTGENKWPEDVSQMKNQTSAAPSMEADDPVFRDDRSVHMDMFEEEPIDEQQVHIGLEQNINEKGKVIPIEDEDESKHTNEKDEVFVIDDDTESDQDTTDEPINIGNTTVDNTWPEDARVKCTKDGTWLISSSDPALIKKSPYTCTNLLTSSSRTRPDNVCWKCEKEGTLLICSRSVCAAKVHKECLNCPVNVDENGNFHCPLCWYNRVSMEYHESQKLMSCAKRRLVKFFRVLATRSKRLKG